MHTSNYQLYYKSFLQEKPSLLSERKPFPIINPAIGSPPLKKTEIEGDSKTMIERESYCAC